MGTSFQTAVALSCVMVIGRNGKFLPAQVAIVDEDGHTLYSTYVRHPNCYVADYKTKITNVTESNLRNGLDFKDVKKAVESSIKYRLLVGHALWTVLKYLGLRHPALDKRDTAEYFKTDHRYPELKDLASEHGVSTQDGDAVDALENARICMKLYKKFQGKWEKSRPIPPEWMRSISNQLEDDRDLSRYHLLHDEWGLPTLQYMERRRWSINCCYKILNCYHFILNILFIIIIIHYFSHSH